MLTQQLSRWLNVLRRTHRAAALYDLIGSPELLQGPADTLLTNMGYWHGEPPAQTLAEANERLVQRVLTSCRLGPRDSLLDVGCGTGGALRSARNITSGPLCGLNASRYQLARADDVLRKCGLASGISLVHGDACDLPFRPGCFDVVISVEAAFHFVSRGAFFREAARVLVPGGRLVFTDLVPVPPSNPWEAANAQALRRGLQIPASSFGRVTDYAPALRAAGFVDIAVHDITDAVVPHHRRWVRSQPFAKQAAWTWIGICFLWGFFYYPWRYVLATATVPRR